MMSNAVPFKSECEELMRGCEDEERQWYLATDEDEKRDLYDTLQTKEIQYVMRMSEIWGAPVSRDAARQKVRSRMRVRLTHHTMLGLPSLPWIADTDMLPVRRKRGKERASRSIMNYATKKRSHIQRRKLDPATGRPLSYDDFAERWYVETLEAIRHDVASPNLTHEDVQRQWRQRSSTTMNLRWGELARSPGSHRFRRLYHNSPMSWKQCCSSLSDNKTVQCPYIVSVFLMKKTSTNRKPTVVKSIDSVGSTTTRSWTENNTATAMGTTKRVNSLL